MTNTSQTVQRCKQTTKTSAKVIANENRRDIMIAPRPMFGRMTRDRFVSSKLLEIRSGLNFGLNTTVIAMTTPIRVQMPRKRKSLRLRRQCTPNAPPIAKTRGWSFTSMYMQGYDGIGATGISTSTILSLTAEIQTPYWLFWMQSTTASP